MSFGPLLERCMQQLKCQDFNSHRDPLGPFLWHHPQCQIYLLDSNFIDYLLYFPFHLEQHELF